MAIQFRNLIVGGGTEANSAPLVIDGQKTSFIEVLNTPTIEASSDAAPLLKSETEEAEILFGDIRVSNYVLDMYDSNK